ncbi:MAG: hypothetical protein PHI20_02660 [Endomicrobiaceae bacterium]|jgi:hypothetical protein|nr:hypothetical protein [Endomicrobiaceae bacterium]MDD3729918.1 hypothetical protein [Endomicrobiaceae bacterium]MDD4166263.1 hypothetical protein [Endomicrobiaceae bacterium]
MTNKIYRYFSKVDYTPFIVTSFIFFLLLILMPNWIYNPIGKHDSDTWLYTGFLFNYKLMYTLYPYSHVTDAISINIPGHLFYEILPVFYANFTLKLTKFIIFGSFLYHTIKLKINQRTALWTLIISLFYFGTLVAFSSDYSDGWLAMYIMGAIYFLLKSDYCWEHINIFISGTIFAIAIGASAQAFVYIPSMFLILLFKEFFNKTEWIQILYKIFIFSIGIIIGIGILYLAYFNITGNFALFGNSINRAEIFLNSGRWFGPLNIYLKNNLLFTIILLFSSVYIYIKSKYIKNDLNILIFISLITNIIALSYMEFINKQETLSCLVYYNAILPFILILFAVNINYFLKLNKLNLKDYIILTAMLFLSCLILYMPVYKTVLDQASMIMMSFENPMPLIYPFVKFQFLIIFAVCFATGVFLTQKKYLRIYIFYIFIILLNFTIWNDWIRNDKYSDQFSGKNMLAATKQWFDYMNKCDPKRNKNIFIFNEEKDTIIKNLLCVSNLKEPVADIQIPNIESRSDIFYCLNLTFLGSDISILHKTIENCRIYGKQFHYENTEVFVSDNIKFHIVRLYDKNKKKDIEE